MKKEKNYVLGFMFNETGNRLVLIKKKHPDWQAGKWNGIGGKVEEAEIPFPAMLREFEEETGVSFRNWENVGTLSGLDFLVTVFWCFCCIEDVKTMTDEEVKIFSVSRLPKVIPNLKWMIPMMREVDFFEVETS